jgi:hypothetical protein
MSDLQIFGVERREVHAQEVRVRGLICDDVTALRPAPAGRGDTPLGRGVVLCHHDKWPGSGVQDSELRRTGSSSNPFRVPEL